MLFDWLKYNSLRLIASAGIIAALSSPVSASSLYLELNESTPYLSHQSEIAERYGVSDSSSVPDKIPIYSGSSVSEDSFSNRITLEDKVDFSIGIQDSSQTDSIQTETSSYSGNLLTSPDDVGTGIRKKADPTLDDDLYDPSMDNPSRDTLKSTRQVNPSPTEIKKIKRNPSDPTEELSDPLMETDNPVSLGMQVTSVIDPTKRYTPKMKYNPFDYTGEIIGIFGDMSGVDARFWTELYQSRKEDLKLSVEVESSHRSFDMNMDDGRTDSYSLTRARAEIIAKYEKEIYRELGRISPILRKYIIESGLQLGINNIGVSSSDNRGLTALIGTVNPRISGEVFLDRENMFKDYHWVDDPCDLSNRCQGADCEQLSLNEQTSPIPFSLLDEQKRLTRFISLKLSLDKEFILGDIGHADYASSLRDLRNEFLTAGFKVGLDGKYDLEIMNSFGRYDNLISAVAHYYWRMQVGDQNIVGRLNLGADDHYGEGFNFFTGADLKFLRPEISPFAKFDDPTLRYYAQASIKAGNRGLSLMGKLPLDWTGLYEAFGFVHPNGEADRNNVLELVGGVEFMFPRDAESMINYMVGISGGSARRPPLDF